MGDRIRVTCRSRYPVKVLASASTCERRRMLGIHQWASHLWSCQAQAKGDSSVEEEKEEERGKKRKRKWEVEGVFVPF